MIIQAVIFWERGLGPFATSLLQSSAVSGFSGYRLRELSLSSQFCPRSGGLRDRQPTGVSGTSQPERTQQECFWYHVLLSVEQGLVSAAA